MTTKWKLVSIGALLFAGSTLAASHPGRVFTLSNESAGNRLLVFDRQADGALRGAGSLDTGGLGTGGGLGNQGALALSRDGHWLVAVNAGSDTMTLFENSKEGVSRRQVVPSGGRRPISVAIFDHHVFVLNAGGAAGGADGVAGFRLDGGRLRRIDGAVAPLSAPNTGPAQVGFASDGSVLVVTEKATNRIDTFVVGEGGELDGPHVYPSLGSTPFGFAVANGDELVVSEAEGGAPNIGTASSYRVDDDGDLEPVTSALPLGQLAPCWVAASRDGRFAYVANAASGSVTGLAIDEDGALALLDPDGLTASTGQGGAPVDEGVSHDGRFLYVLVRGTNTIVGFRRTADGSLESLGAFGHVPATATGLAAR